MDYFFLSVIGFSLGTLARALIPFHWPSLALTIVSALAFLGLTCVSSTRSYVRVSLLFFALALGAGRTMLAPLALPSAFAPLIDTQIKVEGTVVADPDTRETNQHVEIEVTRDGAKTTLLAFAPQYPTFRYGERVRVSGVLEKPEPFETDGGRTFRYDHFLAKDGIFAVVKSAKMESLAPPAGAGRPAGFRAAVMNALYGAKHAFARGIESALPEPSAGLAEGLITGGKQGLGKKLQDAFTITGIVQIVVLSGYNVSVISDWIQKLLSLILPLRFALGGAALGIIAFVLAAGSGSSALRAGLMACIALFARASGRKYDALRALGFVLVMLLIWNPLLLAFDPGFDLSFVATLGLITGTPLIEPYLVRIQNAWLREIIATTLAAQIAVLPLLLYETGNLSFVSVPANILVSMLVPCTMLLSFIAGIIGMLLPAIAPAFGIPAHVFLSLIIAIAEYAAALPLARVIIPAFSFAFVVLAYAALYFSVRNQHTPGRL